MPTDIASGIGRQQPETRTREPRRVWREYDGNGPHMPKPPRLDRRRRPLRISLMGRTYPDSGGVRANRDVRHAPERDDDLLAALRAEQLARHRTP